MTAERLTQLIQPALLGLVSYYHDLGLRERVLTLPLMGALVLSLVWRQLSWVSELLRLLETEGLLWAEPTVVRQQSLSQRLRVLPASLFERLLEELLPTIAARWQERARPLPEEVAWAQKHYGEVLAVDGSTLDSLLRQVGLLREAPKAPLAGRMTALLDVASRLPRRLWFDPNPTSHDQNWWPTILDALNGGLMLFDLGYTNYEMFAALRDKGVTFITRLKSNAAYKITAVHTKTDRLHDYQIALGAHANVLRMRWKRVERVSRGQRDE